MKARASIAFVGVLLAIGIVLPAQQTESRVPVMLLDGQNNHRWAETSPVIRKVLLESGLFDVTVITVPNSELPGFKPDWRKYRVIVMNYNTGITATPPEWLPDVKASFENYMTNGGGLVTVHAADNGFANWPAFNEMIGVGGWGGRDERCGPYWYYKDGKLVRDETPGRGGAHGARVPFVITVRNQHPIVAGLPTTWLHNTDELYERMRGPGKNMTVLATAPSPRTGFDEPMLMALSYGKGRVFHTTLGHDVTAMSSVDFVVTLLRGVEWAATGRVTQKIPADFPRDPNVLAYRLDLAKMDPAYGQPPPAPAQSSAAPSSGAATPPPPMPAPPVAPAGGGCMATTAIR